MLSMGYKGRIRGIATIALIPVMLVLARGPVAATCATLVMLTPPEGQETQWVGDTSGTGVNRWFYKALVVGTSPSTSGLNVTVHISSSHGGGDTLSAPSSGGGQYTTANRDVTQSRSTWTVYATAPGCIQSGNATLNWKKNRQLITCAPDYLGCSYAWGGNGPTTFDCSGLLYYLNNFVGMGLSRTTAQGYYSSRTSVSESNLLPGDWIFFDWDNNPPNGSSIDHDAVYSSGTGLSKVMIQASSTDNVVESSTFNQYYEDHSAGWGHFYGANERY